MHAYNLLFNPSHSPAYIPRATIKPNNTLLLVVKCRSTESTCLLCIVTGVGVARDHGSWNTPLWPLLRLAGRSNRPVSINHVNPFIWPYTRVCRNLFQLFFWPNDLMMEPSQTTIANGQSLVGISEDFFTARRVISKTKFSVYTLLKFPLFSDGKISQVSMMGRDKDSESFRF